MVKIECKIKQ